MSKYKQIIKNIYPSSPDGEMQVHNVTKLVHFCEISPQKIPKVSKYIEKKAKKDMSRSKIKFVGIALRIYQELIKGCRKNLNLLAGNVLNFIKTSLEGNHPELKILATETFIKFAEVIDESSQYPELEAVIAHFFTMCQDSSADSKIRVRVREEGLRGIRAYMSILDMNDELDAFVTRHTDPDGGRGASPAGIGGIGGLVGASRLSFVPTILDNVTYMIDASPGSPSYNRRQSLLQNSVQTLATDVLRDVFTRANISVTSLFRAILGFFDTRNKWIPNTFAILCFDAIYNCLKPQHEQVLMTLLLQHLEQNRPANVKKEIVAIMVEFFRESTGHFMQVLDALSRHLVASVEIVSQDQRARDYEDHLVLQETIITCIGTLCKKVSLHQRMEAFNFYCEKLSSSKHIKPTGLAGAAMAILQCILRVTCELKVEAYDPDWISFTSVTLLKDLAIHPHYEIRVIVQKICQNMLLAGKSLEAYLATKGATNVEVNDKLLTLVAEVIRETLVEQVKIKGNQPENFVALSHSLHTLLHFGGRKEFFVGFPLIFAVQKSGSKWKKIPQQNAMTINTVIATYLYASADLFGCPKLATYVTETIEKRKKANQVCPHIEISKFPFVHVVLNRLRDKYSEEIKKKTAVEYVLFDRDQVIDIICNSAECTLRDETRLKRILAKKIHRNTRTLLRDNTIDLTAQEELINNNNNNNSNNNNQATIPHLPTDAVAPSESLASPVIIFKPSTEQNIEDRRVRVRLGYGDLKSSTEEISEQKDVALPTFDPPHKKSFNKTAQLCFDKGQIKANLLQTVAKVLNYDARQMKKVLAFDANTEESVPDGADFARVTVKVDYIKQQKILYTPPTNTLTMNFHGTGHFFIV